ncbi:MAG: hypothetical protein L0211_21695, partial [Planctomycetaceae bacterium]|nr:hypothetical protein [Planctomycetaceae bacterium]
TMQGEFVRELDGDVTFLVQGKLVTIAIDKLSERDQKIVRDLAAGKQVPDDPAPANNQPAEPASPQPSGAKPAEADPFAPVERAEEPAASGTAPSLAKKRSKGPESRVWTDVFGRKATGKFVRVFGSNVVVSRPGGPLTIDFFELSDADQAYVRELLTWRGEEDLIPVKPPPKREDAEGDPGAPATSDDSVPDSNPGPRLGPPGAGAGPAGSGLGPSGLGPSGRGGFPGPRLGPSGPGFGPAGGGSGPPGAGIPGPRFPPGFGPAANPGTPDTPTTTPYNPGPQPQSSFPGPSASPYSPPQSDFVSESQRRADEVAERARRDAEQMDQRLSDSIQSSANMYQRVPICSSCRKQVTEEQAKGTSCPHCGASWSFNHYATGTSRSTSPLPLAKLSGASSERWVRLVVIIVAAVVAVVVLCGGAIAVAMAIASASRPARQYRSSNF